MERLLRERSEKEMGDIEAILNELAQPLKTSWPPPATASLPCLATMSATS
jgi:hypothetical protein